MLFESGKHESLDVLELSQYSSWLASSGKFDQAEHIANSIEDESIKQRTLAIIAQAMIRRGVLDQVSQSSDPSEYPKHLTLVEGTQGLSPYSDRAGVAHLVTGFYSDRARPCG